MCVHGHCVVLTELRVDDVVVSGAKAPRNTCLLDVEGTLLIEIIGSPK